LLQPNPPDAKPRPPGVSSPHAIRKVVGIISTSRTALQQVAYLLARDGVGVSRATLADSCRESAEENGTAMAKALEALQSDPATEVITLVAQSPSPDAAHRVLHQVRKCDKPTVVCFLGTDPGPVWRAGAIPALRLDEAAMRAAAWIRGWDQALVSSRLEDENERLSAWAGDLKGRIGPRKRGLCGLFSSRAFYDEAQLALSKNSPVDAARPPLLLNICLVKPEPQKLVQLRRALGAPALAVVLVDTVLGAPSEVEMMGNLTAIRELPVAPLVVTHVCGSAHDLRRAREKEALLRDAGIVVTSSNATAAYLAKSLIGEVSEEIVAKGGIHEKT
jgi:FdrA protein